MAPNQPPPKESHYWGPSSKPAEPGIDKWKGIALVYDPQPNETYMTGTQSNATTYEEPKKPVDRDYYARKFGGKKRNP